MSKEEEINKKLKEIDHKLYCIEEFLNNRFSNAYDHEKFRLTKTEEVADDQPKITEF